MAFIKKNIIAFIPALIWAGIIAFMSLLPHKKLPDSILTFSDKFMHAAIYWMLTLLFLFAFSLNTKTIIKSKSYIVFGTISFLFGVLIEFLQAYLSTNRSADWKDVVANCIGIFLAITTFKFISKSNLLDKYIFRKIK